jgi:hypothetical protein
LFSITRRPTAPSKADVQLRLVSAGYAYYQQHTLLPGWSLTPEAVVSQEKFLDGEDITRPSTHCGAVNPPFEALVWFGPVKTVDINSLGFVPPFSVQLE